MDYVKYNLSDVEKNTLTLIQFDSPFTTAAQFDEDDAALKSLVTLGYVRPVKRPSDPGVIYIVLTDHGERRLKEIDDDDDGIERPH